MLYMLSENERGSRERFPLKVGSPDQRGGKRTEVAMCLVARVVSIHGHTNGFFPSPHSRRVFFISVAIQCSGGKKKKKKKMSVRSADRRAFRQRATQKRKSGLLLNDSDVRFCQRTHDAFIQGKKIKRHGYT